MQGSSGGHGWTQLPLAPKCISWEIFGTIRVVDRHHTKVPPHMHANKKLIMAERTVRFNVPWRPNVVLTSSEWNSRFLSQRFAHITALSLAVVPNASVFLSQI